MTFALWLLVGLPAAGGLGLLVGGRRANDVAAPLAVGFAVLGLGIALVVAFGRPSVEAPLLVGIPAGFAVDGLSAVMVVVVAAVAVAVLVYAAGELDRPEARARFFGLMLVFTAAMLITVTATNLLVLLAGWEVMGAMSYALIGFWWTEPDRVRSGHIAFLTTRAGDLGLYIAAGAALAGGVGSLALAGLAQADAIWLHVICGGVIVAALGKSAQLPFSFWLSRAMAGPSPVSALLHSATMVAAGGYLLLRLQPVLQASGWGQPVVAWVGVTTAVLLGAVALAQRDLKQLLAASTCSQIGFIVLAAGVSGLTGGALQLVAHAATKSLLFLCAGTWLSALGTKDLAALGGVARRYPVVGATFTVGALSLAGLPPLSIWVAKDEILAAAREQSPALYLLGLAAAAISALYAARALAVVWGPPPADPGYDTEQRGTRTVNRLMGAPLPLLAVAAAGLGLLGASGVLRDLLAGGEEPTPSFGELALSAAVAVAAVGAVFAMHRWGRSWPTARALSGWLGLEWLAVRGIAVLTMRLAAATARFDDRVLDRAVMAVAAAGPGVARLSARWLEIGFDGAVRDVGAGARRLGALARRPQTGQLHQYYAQATAVLAGLALLLLLVR